MNAAAKSRHHVDGAAPTARPLACVASVALHVGGILVASGLIGSFGRVVRPTPAWIAVVPHAPLPEPAPEPTPVESVRVDEPPEPTWTEELTRPEPVPWMADPEPVEAAPLPWSRMPTRNWLARVQPEPDAIIDEAAPCPVLVEPTPLTSENRPPDYPEPALRQHVQGTVMVELQLAADGRVTATRVLHSSGSTMLDEAATAALAQWHFAPARRDGVPVRSTFRQEVVFRIPAR